ncbi:TPA: conserved phage C-terminal domain-containing protein [Escherichia coli]|uniref:conserved phage C-terminal domain-containing protein n=2 Tax=Enterobacteriaceae TaxID=543 RepID=UPI000E0188F8|nr:conserved phage C-terminal domain-containing protein [Escherichia coli]EFN4809671.1 transcriptional regulator [Escherichia coli]EFP0620258.1 transcriptional regulator [Escherichia coli]EIH1035892.1 conserved phage C-terminal domain-containing protein [Escherichia coli]EIJ1048537.1 conserved phage C-terminal domain-containing protein [Escherichia coli]EIT3842242.1 conserved phage C-terminal domain-containing protein [Escherichia coli]
MSLLMTSRPIVINPDLAYSIGLNEAIALQQINYWLQETKSGMESDGVRWIYNTTEQWLEQFPFWSESTLKRTFTRLKTLGVLKIEQLNKSQRDMTNFYTINYESELLDEVKVTESKRSKCAVPSGQNDTMEEVKVTHSIRSKRTAVIRSKCTDDPTENTTESTTEITGKDSCPVAGQPDPEVVITDQAILVLSHLNQISGSRYQKSKTSLENIRARLRDGYSVADLQLVIDLKHEHWHENDEQYQYMRPETLFGPRKFESYLQSATRWDQKGRPKRADWGAKRRDVMDFGPVDTTIPAGFRG